MAMLTKWVNRILSIFSVFLYIVLVCCVIWQVLSRYVLGTPSIVTDELSRFLFMWVGLIGAAYVTGLKRHLAIDLLLIKTTGQKKKILEIVILVIMLFFASFILVYGGANLAWDTHISGQISPSIGLDMGLVYLCIPISGLIMMFYILVDLIEKITNKPSSLPTNTATITE
ncbi:MAG: TRAP transporter small permease [Pasteurellaceae bacterium]|nr:TRAP transporter small permease [Pasteurellaceae bacterium]